MVRDALVKSARDMSRHLSVLLFAGLWALALIWTPSTTRLSEDRVVTSLGQVESSSAHPASETPNFGAPEQPDARVDHHAILAAGCAPTHGSAAAMEPPVVERRAASHRHHVAHSARGPPTRA